MRLALSFGICKCRARFSIRLFPSPVIDLHICSCFLSSRVTVYFRKIAISHPDPTRIPLFGSGPLIMAPQGTILYHGIEISERERDFLERSIAGMSNVDESKLKDKKGHYEPSKGVRDNQNRMGRRWMLYVASYPGASVHCVASLEDFMLVVGTATLGKKGDDHYFRQLSEEEKSQRQQAAYQTIRNSWNNFCGWCKRMNHPISPEHKEHMTQYNKQFLRKVAKLRDSVRESKFASDFHYGILAVYTFRRNNIQYGKLKAMIIHWTMSSISFFGSHRIGDIAKSSAREDSAMCRNIGMGLDGLRPSIPTNTENGYTTMAISVTSMVKVDIVAWPPERPPLPTLIGVDSAIIVLRAMLIIDRLPV